ncbi:hypothetical protein ACJX0J_006557, partial [Zea mays]
FRQVTKYRAVIHEVHATAQTHDSINNQIIGLVMTHEFCAADRQAGSGSNKWTPYGRQTSSSLQFPLVDFYLFVQPQHSTFISIDLVTCHILIHVARDKV